MFLKLHNSAVTALRDETSGVDVFEEARRRVRWQFQWLVRFDFLPRICDPSVYRDIITDGHRLFDWPPGGFSIPVEFSHGAARFGHSMVRPKYDLNRNSLDVTLNRIIAEVHKPGALDPAFAIDWQRFFTAREPANNLDTAIPEAMFELPIEALRRFGASISEDNPAELPVRTLRRGAAMKLPTGEQVRDAFGSPAIVQGFEEFPNYAPAKVLVDLRSQWADAALVLRLVGSGDERARR